MRGKAAGKLRGSAIFIVSGPEHLPSSVRSGMFAVEPVPGAIFV
jgi:hypothetical protein